MGLLQVLLLRVCVDLGVIAMKGCSRLTRAPGREPHYKMLFSASLSATLFWRGSYASSEELTSAFLAPQTDAM